MPCDDITEYVEVVLSQSETLQSYSLTKGTCGGPIGEAGVLADHLAGMSVTDIIASDSERFDNLINSSRKSQQFILYKHLFALKSVLQAYSGEASGGVDDSCNLIGIEHDEETITIKAWIKIDGLTEDIKACGKKCGRAPKKSQAKSV